MKINRVAEILNTWSSLPGPLHQRLTTAIQDAIRQGNFFPGMRLPAERLLAQSLAISRTTVVASYNDLRSTGWIESRTGSGTWVSTKNASAVRAIARTALVSRSPLLNALQAAETGAIDLATTTTTTIPLSSIIAPALATSFSDIHSMLSAREYLPFGLPLLRQAIARYYTQLETPTIADEILITTGGQQAISLVCSLLVQRGDHVLVESPTYYGALECLRMTGARIAPLPITDEHISPHALMQRVAAVSPRLIYLTPTGQNPTGHIMSDPVKSAVAKDSLQHGVTLVEDEVLADMTFTTRRPRPIASFLQPANILTLGSLSKLFWPGLRVGWIRGPRAVIARLGRLKTAADLGSPLLTQSIAVELLDSLSEARALRRKELSAKKDLVLRLIRSRIPTARVRDTQGGLALWVKLPGIDTRLLAQVALRHGLALSYGNLFSVDETHADHLRVPFVLDKEQLVTAIERLAAAHAELAGIEHHHPTYTHLATV